MQPHKRLLLYKRHRPDCDVHGLGLNPAAARQYMNCECAIWVVGRTPEGHLVPRQTTGAKNMEDAAAQIKLILAKSAAVTRAEAIKDGDESVHGPTVAECAEAYLESRRHELSDKTYGQT